MAQLAGPGTPVLTVYNKIDLGEVPFLPPEGDAVAVCARTGEGLETLLHNIEQKLLGTLHRVTLLLPYQLGGQVDTLHQKAQVQSVEYEAEGIRVRAVLDEPLYGRLRQYVTEEA